MTDLELFRRLAALKSAGMPCCLVTIVDARGSTPRGPGAKMIVCADKTTWGSVGGGCGEKQAISAALRCLLSTRKPELLRVDLTDDLGARGGDVCGGSMSVFVEPAGPGV